MGQIVKLKVIKMTKQTLVRGSAEELVRKVLTETFKQNADEETILIAAKKINRALPDVGRTNFPEEAH